MSACQDNVQICRILVESKADVTLQDCFAGSSDTPLDIAIKCNKSGVAAYLRKIDNARNGANRDGSFMVRKIKMYDAINAN